MTNRPNAEQVSGTLSILMMDPPDHTRIRQLVSRAFTPRAVERFLPTIGRLAQEVLESTQGSESLDLVADLAYPLPVTVISALLGIPLEDRVALRRWSHAITAGIDVVTDVAAFAAAQAAHQSMATYLRDAVRERRRHPKDDLLTDLLAAEEAGDRLSEGELTNLLVLLVVAGHETTVNLITNGLWGLWHDEEALDRVRHEGLTGIGIEELLRFDSPVQATARMCREDLTIDGRTLPTGAFVGIWLGAANRDPAVFAHPDRLDLDREPNRHMAFGGGIHTCLGASLAAAEGRAALNALLQHHPRLEVVESSARWRPGVLFRGLEALTIQV
jgi:pimeloyl-[acyl-carrier protein] synthase